MLASEWAQLEGLNKQTVWRWHREGLMPVPVEHTPSGAWLVHDPHYKTHTPAHSTQGKTIAYAKVSTLRLSQKDNLQRQADRLKAITPSHHRDSVRHDRSLNLLLRQILQTSSREEQGEAGDRGDAG